MLNYNSFQVATLHLLDNFNVAVNLKHSENYFMIGKRLA